MKSSHKGCAQVGHNNFTPNIFYWHLYIKSSPKDFSCFLSTSTNTRLWHLAKFHHERDLPYYFEGNFDLIDGYSLNITGDVIPFQYYGSQLTVILPSHGALIYICTFMYPIYCFFGLTEKKLLELLHVIYRHRFLTPVLNVNLFVE